jgi:hypothetical protein
VLVWLVLAVSVATMSVSGVDRFESRRSAAALTFASGHCIARSTARSVGDAGALAARRVRSSRLLARGMRLAALEQTSVRCDVPTPSSDGRYLYLWNDALLC